MIPNPSFIGQPGSFWANVRTISQQAGYTVRGGSDIKVPSLQDIRKALASINLSDQHIANSSGELTDLGRTLAGYFEYRADSLNSYVRPRLMDAVRARRVFEELKQRLNPKLPVPMNKQGAAKKAPAYLTGIVNMIIETNCQGLPFEHNPTKLTTVTRSGQPLRTLARRVDGAFPGTVNPIAVWEIKEYYYTTTFGSRVADGIYETLLDGLELEELRKAEGVNVLHYLMVDALFTWWNCGKSYLCRIVDMLHMGYLDEALFGYEAVERLPDLVARWCAIASEPARLL